MLGTRSISGNSVIGCSGESDCAKERSTKVTPTRRTPAFTFTRMLLKRFCMSSAAIAWRWSTAFRSSGPPASCWNTRRPSMVRITRCVESTLVT